MGTNNPFDYYALASMCNIKQFSSIDHYYSQFDCLRTFILWHFPGICDAYFFSQFICGLKMEIQVYVLQHHPINVLDAYELALIREYNLRRVQNMTNTHSVKTCDHIEAPMPNEALQDATKTQEEVSLPLDHIATLDEMSGVPRSLQQSPVSMNGALDAYDASYVLTDVVLSTNLNAIRGTKMSVHTIATVDDGPKVCAAMETSIYFNRCVPHNQLEFFSSTHRAEVGDLYVILPCVSTRISSSLSRVIFRHCIAMSYTVQYGDPYNILDKGGTHRGFSALMTMGSPIQPSNAFILSTMGYILMDCSAPATVQALIPLQDSWKCYILYEHFNLVLASTIIHKCGNILAIFSQFRTHIHGVISIVLQGLPSAWAHGNVFSGHVRTVRASLETIASSTVRIFSSDVSFTSLLVHVSPKDQASPNMFPILSLAGGITISSILLALTPRHSAFGKMTSANFQVLRMTHVVFPSCVHDKTPNKGNGMRMDSYTGVFVWQVFSHPSGVSQLQACVHISHSSAPISWSWFTKPPRTHSSFKYCIVTCPIYYGSAVQVRKGLKTNNSLEYHGPTTSFLLVAAVLYLQATDVCCSGNSIHTGCDSSFGVSWGSCLALASGVEAAECFISYPYNRNFIRLLADILQLNKDDRGGFALQDYLGVALIYDDINFGFLNHLLVAKVWNMFSPSNALSATVNDVNSRHSVQGYLLNYLPPLYSVLSVTRVPCEARPSVIQLGNSHVMHFKLVLLPALPTNMVPPAIRGFTWILQVLKESFGRLMFASSLHFRALQDHALCSGSSNDFNARSSAASGSLIDGRGHASLTDSQSVTSSQFITFALILLIILRWHSGIAAIPGHAMPQIGVQNACQLSVEVYACVPNEHLARQRRVLVDSTSTPSNITSNDQGAIRDKGGTAILEIERVTDMVPVLVSFNMNGIWWFSSRHLQLPMQCSVREDELFLWFFSFDSTAVSVLRNQPPGHNIL